MKKDARDRHMKKLLQETAQAARLDDLNLLYVAMTRAAQYLYLVGDSANNDKPTWFTSLKQHYGPFTGNDDALWYEKQLFSFTPDKIAQHTMPRTKKTDALTPRSDVRLQKKIPAAVLHQEIAPSYIAETPLTRLKPTEKGTLRGILLHELLNLLTTQADIPKTGLKQRLSIPVNDDFYTDILNEAKRVLSHPDLMFLFDNNYLRALNEVPLIYTLGGKTVNGVIDRLLEFDDKIIVIDYKSHRIEKPDVPKVAETYRSQIQYYCDGVSKIWPDKVIEAYLLFTAVPLLFPMNITPGQDEI